MTKRLVRYYMAARFQRRAEMETIAYGKMAEAMPNWRCCARWVFGGEDGLTRPEIAKLDLEDVAKADVLMIHTHQRGSKQPGGGRFVEMGYALALGKRIVVIGDYENVFCHTPGVEVYPTLEAFILNNSTV